MGRITDRHRQFRAERGALSTSEMERLRDELEGLKARSAEIEANLGIVPKWQTGVSYEVGDTVAYNGATYECISAHDSQVTWEPDTATSLWSEVG